MSNDPLSKIPVVSIVDDDESIRSAVGALVKLLGFTAHSFASAVDFLGSTGMDATSCLISDIQMPEMSGIELQRALTARNIRLPIIFITAFPDPDVEATARKAGAVCFLSKPFETEMMIDCLERALKHYEPASSNG
jgi:FixJ family two-component response regulator